jgi:hypothetical protein
MFILYSHNRDALTAKKHQLGRGFLSWFFLHIRKESIMHQDVTKKRYNPVAIGFTLILGLIPQSSNNLSKLLPFGVNRFTQYSSK